MSIDFGQLAASALPFVLANLNYIRGKVADAALTESGKALVTVVKEKWLAKNEAASAAVEEAAKDPTDADNRDALLAFLRKAFKADPELAGEVARLLPLAAGAPNPQQLNQSGDHNKGAVVGGSGHTVIIS